MTLASGVGSLPGEDIAEAVRLVLGELPDLPHLPELPARGVHAGMTGRALGAITELGFDLQPAGWRLTGSGSAGADQRRARSLLAQDLDALEEQAADYNGPLKLQLTGPWTLAATVERPRGDRLLGDPGARRELAQALAVAAAEHVADVRRRVPGAQVVLQVDEPAITAVLEARVPTASGLDRHRRIDPPRAAEALTWLREAAEQAGADVVVHSCADDPPVALLRQAGATAVSVDLLRLSAEGLDELGELLDAGERAYLGVVPSVGEDTPTTGSVVDRVVRVLDMLGHDPDVVGGQLVLTPTCGLAAASPAYVREALRTLGEAATGLTAAR